ncbi:MAG TPA: PQQ-dependent sugar dehydrogenase [Anaerolineales bacterium]|nr:PQQ-dependent sugar dehydrogenase [Anaerolineales bacterium]
MSRKGFWIRASAFMISLSLLLSFAATPFAAAQATGPTMLHPQLGVRPVVSGLNLPTTMAFFSANEFFVLEKNTGIVQVVMNGAIHHAALDLAVNNFSERGLLGIALDPDFSANHYVYLFWSCQGPAPTDPFTPSAQQCAATPELGADSEDPLAVPLLGNRVDRFIWDGTNLTFDINLIMLRAFQNDGAPNPPGQGDEAQPPRGNHDGGVLAFGQDGKLYIFVGDLGRRGGLQNLPCGPTPTCSGTQVPDDQFGGPEPDNAHLSGVVLRLNTDGSIPSDNPFYETGAAWGGEVGANIQKIFSYGHRNGFGMAVDPASGNLWLQENGDDSFSEINRVDPGLNGGWVQIAGPVERIGQFKDIETTFGNMQLQQLRWPPTNLADTPEEALDRLVMIPGATYKDPEFSWKWEVAPGGINFLAGKGLGAQFQNDLFVGAATPALEGGYLFHFNLTRDREKFSVSDPRLRDRVADNLAKHEITESESLLIGRDFGAITDIETGPNGNLFVVSITNGTVYEIFNVKEDKRRDFLIRMTGAAEAPGPGDPDGRGIARLSLKPAEGEVCFALRVSKIALPATGAHIHQAPVGSPGPVVVPLTPPNDKGFSSGCVSADPNLIRNIIQNPTQYYVNVHNAEFPAGAVRGQLK